MKKLKRIIIATTNHLPYGNITSRDVKEKLKSINENNNNT